MKTVVITGVSRGVGKAIAEIFLKNGYYVIGTSTSGKNIFKHTNFNILSLDLSKSESISSCVKEIQNLDRPIDFLINNAALGKKLNGDTTLNQDVFRNLMEVNVFGLIDFTESLLSAISNDGHIVNISSRQGSLAYQKDPSNPDYKISKAAVNMYTRVLAARLKDKITVSSIHPGWVRTDMGGENADMDPMEAAEDIYNTTLSKVETGQLSDRP